MAIVPEVFGQNSMDVMPAQFADLTVARIYQKLVERRAMYWMPWIEARQGPNFTLCFHHVEEMDNGVELQKEKGRLLVLL
jgi:hypothetical protein